jgi:hypothetical protein
VSRGIETTRNATQPSARTVFKVDSGIVSPEKAIRRIEHADLHRRAMRVFCCRRIAAGFPESVPARVARRRLAAGPTPAALLCTGQLYPQVN